MGVPLEDLPSSDHSRQQLPSMPFFVGDTENLTEEAETCFMNDAACPDVFNECFTRVDATCVSTRLTS